MLVETLNSNYQKGFFDVVGVILNGALVPLIVRLVVMRDYQYIT